MSLDILCQEAVNQLKHQETLPNSTQALSSNPFVVQTPLPVKKYLCSNKRRVLQENDDEEYSPYMYQQSSFSQLFKKQCTSKHQFTRTTSQKFTQNDHVQTYNHDHTSPNYDGVRETIKKRRRTSLIRFQKAPVLHGKTIQDLEADESPIYFVSGCARMSGSLIPNKTTVQMVINPLISNQQRNYFKYLIKNGSWGQLLAFDSETHKEIPTIRFERVVYSDDKQKRIDFRCKLIDSESIEKYDKPFYGSFIQEGIPVNKTPFIWRPKRDRSKKTNDY